MPSKNRLKTYLESGYYHIYNRGVEKRKIFLDQQDYGVFLSYLKEYLLSKNEHELQERLSDPNTSYKERNKILRALRMNNFYEEITLLAYCLMPNHFHFFIKQKSALSIDKFMQSLCTRYSMYFNKKYKRVGSLYQDIYKAASVVNDPQFLYLSKYIHKQSIASKGTTFRGWREQPSSYLEYLGKRKTEWVKPDEVLSFFSETNSSLSYQSFVEESDDIGPIENIILED